MAAMAAILDIYSTLLLLNQLSWIYIPEKGRKEIEERVEEMKERDASSSESKGQLTRNLVGSISVICR